MTMDIGEVGELFEAFDGALAASTPMNVADDRRPMTKWSDTSALSAGIH
jgi:hypothetical protein